MEPQGPLDPQIYWRRRMAAGGGALVLLIVLIIIIAVSCSGGSGSGSEDPEDTAALPAATSTAAPSTSVEASKDPEAADPKADDAEDKDADETAPKPETPPGHCSEDVLAVTVTPDQATYSVGDKPKFVMAITNSGIGECDVDVSEHLRGLTVTTLAGDPVWALWDCNEPVEEQIRTLSPERRQISYETDWAGTTSAHGCTPQERLPVEPGEYAVTANLGTLTSAAVTFNVV